MDLKQFLAQAKKPEFWATPQAIVFRGEGYPVLFFTRLFAFLRGQGAPARQTLLMATTPPPEVQRTLAQSFLGTSNVYWLGEVPLKPTKKDEKLLAYIGNYQGPHTIAYFVHNDAKGVGQHALQVLLPAGLSEHRFREMGTLLCGEQVLRQGEVIAQVFMQSMEIELDVACMLYDYLELLSARTAPSFTAQLSKIIQPQTSLHALSKAFFERKGREFFSLWSQVKGNYSDMFWLTFFSEQLWQACHVVGLQRAGKLHDAKRVGYRLPFSFFKTTWRKVNPHKLAKAHALLYQGDYALKRGSSFPVLDYFFSKHFS